MSASKFERASDAANEHDNKVVPLRAMGSTESNSGRPSIFKPAAPKPLQSEDTMDLLISEELDFVVRRLEQVRYGLSQDAILVQRHGYELQNIGFVNQALRDLAQVVKAQDKKGAAESISSVDVRGRLLPKSINPILSKQ